MTETSPTGTFTPRDGPVKPGSCGIPLPGVEFKFVDVADPGARWRSASAAKSASGART